VGRGDRVALQVEKAPEAIYLYLACLRLGVVFLPLNPSYTPAETGYFLADAETSLYLCDSARLAAHHKSLPGRALAFAGDAGLSALADAAPARAPDPGHRPDDLAAILYTSGTTGRSKGVMLTRANLASNAHALRHAWAFTSRDVILHALPIFHTHGLFVATNTAIVSGASLLFLSDFKPAAVLAALPAATVMMGVPTYYTRLLADAGLTRAACAHMRLFISGSAPLSAVTHQEWRDRTGHAILERYGMTETNMLTSNPYEGERRAGTVGMALPGVEVRVADPTTGASLPGGEVGGIEVKGPNVFQGYWRAPEKTAAEFRADGFFITGDMGMVDADGYLHIVGRARDMVITGGLNVYPAEVEAALDDLPGVAASAVIGVPHPDFGEAVVALVIPRPGVQLSGDDLRAALRVRLAGYKLPKAVVMEAEFPRNAMGKVQKNVLRERFRDMFTGMAD
jgi:malonyl-CoA/methylmalonyl-CoA synthetase